MAFLASLPREDNLPLGAVVVRGGVLDSFEGFQESVKDHFAKGQLKSGTGVYGLSVCSLSGLSAEEILRALPDEHKLPHARFRESTVGALRELGFKVYPSEWHGHATLEFSALPTEQDWEKLQQAFSEPRKIPNELRRKRT